MQALPSSRQKVCGATEEVSGAASKVCGAGTQANAVSHRKPSLSLPNSSTPATRPMREGRPGNNSQELGSLLSRLPTVSGSPPHEPFE